MLLTTDQLSRYRQQLAMVDGSFDPIHDGHIGYFKAASELGVPLLCNVAPDSWTVTKHPVFLEQQQRGVVLDSIRYIAFVHLANVATVEPLLIVFKEEIRDNLIVNNPEDRSFFTKEQCEMINGIPFKESDQDTVNDLLTITDLELKFWDRVGISPNYIYELAETGWEEHIN